MATNNGTHRVQNDTHTYSLNNSNISIPIATRGGSIVIEKEIIKRQAAYINKNTPGHRKQPIQMLQKVQNRCLRVISGAYKATPIPVLESEVFMPLIEVSLNQIVAYAKLKRRTYPVTTVGNKRIRQNLRKPRAKRSKARTPIPPPTEAKRE